MSANKKFWYPKVNLTAAYNYNGQDQNFKFGNNDNKLFFGQLGVRIPIFSGGRNRAEIEKAKTEKESAAINFKNTKQNFLKELKNAENSYNNSLNNIGIFKETIALNENENRHIK